MVSADSPFAFQARPQALYRWVPLLAVLRDYKSSWLIRDMSAGLFLPRCLSCACRYGLCAGVWDTRHLRVICLLFRSLLMLFLGPSRILILGPDSALVALIAATILPLVPQVMKAGRWRWRECWLS